MDPALSDVALDNSENATTTASISNASNRLFSTKKINVTLDDHNYLLWHQQVYLIIKTHRLLKFIDPKDGALATWLLSTVSETALPHLIGLNTSSEIWNTLHRLYSGKTTSRLMSYRRLLHSQKKGDLCMKDYLMSVKTICDNLVNCGEVISEHEQITAILNGLSPEYESVITVITTGSVASDVKFVRTILLDAEARQSNINSNLNVSAHMVTHQTSIQHSPESSNNANAGYALNTSQNSYANTYNNRDSNRGRSRGRFNGSRPQCQLCGKIGHLVERCYHRFDLSFRNESSRNSQGQNNAISSVDRNSQSSQANLCPYSANPLHASLPSNAVFYTTPTMSSIQGYPSFVPQTQNPIMLHNVTGSSNGSFRGYSPVISHISNHVLSSSTCTTQTSHVYNPMMSQLPPLCQPIVSQAFIATPEVLDDNAWYPDSGATHHLTKDVHNLQPETVSPTSGAVQVGNGNKLFIKYLGQSTFLNSDKHLCLNNVLYAPGITKNLLSVSKFTQDNQASLEFYPTFCQARALSTGRVLFKGYEKNGLYKLHGSFSHVNKNPVITTDNKVCINATASIGKHVVSSPLQNISLQTNPSVSTSQQNTSSLSVTQQSTPSTSLPQQVISSLSIPSSLLLSVSSTQQHDIGTSSPSLPLPSSSPTSLPLPSPSPSPLPPPLVKVQNTHPMVTRAKSGIFKPKVYITELENKELVDVLEALQHSGWRAVVYEEYNALIRNGT
ncbi:hypothetical protein GQ457_12G008730 [Hibiscus cannabinus]